MTDNKQNARKQAQRRARQRKQRNRRIALTACLMIAVMVASIGGTLAWLTDQTGPVTNTFTAGNIDITLDETPREYKMVPDHTIDKDPKVTVKAGSEACWLFVEITKAGFTSEEGTEYTFDQFLEYTVDVTPNGTSDTNAVDHWTKLESETGRTVYYRQVDATGTNNVVFPVLANNQVKVKNTVTKAMLNDVVVPTATTGTVLAPTLTFNAYAVQWDTSIDTVEKAWNVVKDDFLTTNP